jgi:SAM-dependent methyltransferase
VLELGCGSGDLLQLVRELGNPDVLGIEPNRAAAELACCRWGVEVIASTLEAARLPSLSVDVVLVQHVLEHLPSPSATLAEVGRILRPGGTLVLWLPNVDSWAARVWRAAWMGYDPPRHLYVFDLRTLRALLERHGFSLASVRHEWVGIEWSWGLRLALRLRGHDSGLLDRALGAAHIPLTLGATPLSLAAAVARRSGRVRVVARRTS